MKFKVSTLVPVETPLSWTLITALVAPESLAQAHFVEAVSHFKICPFEHPCSNESWFPINSSPENDAVDPVPDEEFKRSTCKLFPDIVNPVPVKLVIDSPLRSRDVNVPSPVI